MVVPGLEPGTAPKGTTVAILKKETANRITTSKRLAPQFIRSLICLSI
jgi:hypothetical protein